MGIGWIGLLGKISNSLIEMGYSEKHILLLNLRNYLILIEVCGEVEMFCPKENKWTIGPSLSIKRAGLDCVLMDRCNSC